MRTSFFRLKSPLKDMKHFVLICILILPFVFFSQKNIEKGFQDLKDKNLGQANIHFRSGLKKSGSIASYGLSKLYVTLDYRNLDSAYHFALQSQRLWPSVEPKTQLAWKKDFAFEQSVIDGQLQAVSQLIFEQIQASPSVYTWNQFIQNHPHYIARNTAIYLRDQLAFEIARQKNTSSALKFYLDSLPESSFTQEAKHLFFDLEYAEITADGKLASYVRFYDHCPSNTHLMEAAQEIYRLATVNHTLTEFVQFVRTYPINPFVNEAWRNVYKIYLKEYSAEKYAAFQQEFPDYPFMQELAIDIDLFQMKLYPVISSGKYGFMNAQGKLMIPAIYNEVGPFQEGLAVVSKEDLFGIIDKKNQVIVDFQYDEILEFVSNRAIVRKGEKYGVIDRLGKLIFPLIYDDISLSDQGIYDVVSNGTNSLFDLNHQAVTSVEQVAQTTFSQKMSLQFPTYELVGELDRTSNRAVVKINGQLNYIDSTGKIILTTPLEWYADALSLSKFQKGFAVFRKKEKYGLIDVNGKVVQKNVYELSGPYTGFWPVKDKGNWALLDAKGKVVLPFEYDFIRYIDDLGYLIERDAYFGLINATSQMILPVSFSTIKNFDSRYYLVSIDDKLGLFSKEGKEVLSVQYDRISRFDDECIVLYMNGKMTYYFPSEHSFLSLAE